MNQWECIALKAEIEWQERLFNSQSGRRHLPHSTISARCQSKLTSSSCQNNFSLSSLFLIQLHTNIGHTTFVPSIVLLNYFLLLVNCLYSLSKQSFRNCPTMAGVIALSLFVSALLLPSSVIAVPKTLGLKFDVKRHQSESPTVTKRARSVGGALSNEKIRYLMNITVGTPPQYLEIKLDTGSSDMWIPSANSKMCQEFAEECLEHGSCRSSTCLQIQLLSLNLTMPHR